tara:strand:- start:2453 stop:2848 length:396 start_codon:yes stop_codon:yes gene_type:complete
MYNIFPKKNTYLILLFFFISLQSFSQNLSSKINEDEKFIKLLKLSKEANSEYFKSNFFSIQVYSGQYKQADSILKFVNEKYLNDSIFFFFETPNYKVQVGKFKSKIEAQKKLRSVIKDFKAAFILKPNTKI